MSILLRWLHSDRSARCRARMTTILLLLGEFVLCLPAAQADEPLKPHHDLTYYLDQEGARQPIKDFETWEIRRRVILQAVQEVMGPLPTEARRVPLDIQIEEEVTLEGGLTRRKITYQSEPGSRVPAYLFLPKAKERQRLPAVLCLHQTVRSGKAEPAGLPRGDKSYALALAERGYVTIAPDYPSFGDHAWDFSPQRGYASGSMKAIWDNTRAVDLLSAMPEVDGERIGCIGHSLGGHNAIFTAIFEPRIRVIVASCGFSRMDLDDLPSWSGQVYMPRINSKFGGDIHKFPFDFPELLAVLAPRPFLTCSTQGDTDFNVQGVIDCLTFASPVYKLYDRAEVLRGVYPAGPHGFPAESQKAAYEFIDKHLRDSDLLADWPQSLPEKNGPIWIPAQSWPQHPGERRVRVLVHYPGGLKQNVNAETGIMLTLHNWGGTDCVGTASPRALAEKLNVIALCVNYLQSGPQASIHDPEPYDFGYLQALDAIRAHFIVSELLKKEKLPHAAGRNFATGGSGGGNVSLMAGKLAPRTFAAIIDMCGMARLTDDIAFNLPGGSDLDARFSRDAKSPNYLSPGRQELHYVGNPAHLKTMRELESEHELFVVHGLEDATCPVADAQAMVGSMRRAGLEVHPHFIAKENLDGKVFLSAGHSLGNRTEIVFQVAGPKLAPGGKESLALQGQPDFARRDEKVRYKVTGGTYIISYLSGYPVARFEPE